MCCGNVFAKRCLMPSPASTLCKTTNKNHKTANTRCACSMFKNRSFTIGWMQKRGCYICAMRATEDTYRHKGLRKKLVELVRSKGVTDEKMLQAIGKVPRHFFLDSAFDEVAYEDRAFPIAEKQTISQHSTVAYQKQLMELQPFMQVLE